jgi:hypothetical protein
VPGPTADDVPLERRRLLRREVGLLRQRETRRTFDTAVHVGRLGGESAGFVARAQDLPVLDAGLRTDVVCGLLAGLTTAAGTAWVVRAGTPEVQDVDLRWFAAARTATDLLGRGLDGCYVVTRTGWLDLVTGRGRTWVRLRL